MREIKKHGHRFYVGTGSIWSGGSTREVARIVPHYGNPHNKTPHYFTVRWSDPRYKSGNKFKTAADAEGYIRLIHSLNQE